MVAHNKGESGLREARAIRSIVSNARSVSDVTSAGLPRGCEADGWGLEFWKHRKECDVRE